jgi:hypothetical protein
MGDNTCRKALNNGSLKLAIDEKTGDYTRLTCFKPGADTSLFGPKIHDYPEEIMIIEGRLYDEAFDEWLEKGDYASRPPGAIHGPFKTDSGCVVRESATQCTAAIIQPDSLK